MSKQLHDVFAVHMGTFKMRCFGEATTERNADAIVSMAVMRRGVDTEFYVVVPTGLYKEGDTWEGDTRTPLPVRTSKP